ncbi:zinc-binding dehydrogenase [Conexibacter sp. DBS9H8]|uniref:zinc-binding dehydrogenase n=1 Tax=Conexibacter sp. DBS9H8 TaxID=2937801 RepID=UPI00200D1A18|nr:zinc-binding dehydrogenase [Conexibacter sp. DBS9H8]
MRAVTLHPDHSITVSEHPDPRPGAGEILVQVRAAGLNGADMAQRQGRYPAPPGFPPDIPGLEFSGEVLECGPGAARFGPGDRVCAITGGGAQAELVTIHERLVMPVPGQLAWVAAGGAPEAYSTAYDALCGQAGLQAGERVLIHGAAGGVGTAAVQLAAAFRAEVHATVRNPDHRDAVAKLGATVHAPDDFSAHGPFDVILELVGAPNLPADVASLAPWGRIVVIGIGAGAEATLNLGVLMYRRGRILASTLRARPLEEKALLARALERSVMPLLGDGVLTVPVAATYPLDRVADAYDRFSAGGKLGKVVLLPAGDQPR